MWEDSRKQHDRNSRIISDRVGLVLTYGGPESWTFDFGSCWKLVSRFVYESNVSFDNVRFINWIILTNDRNIRVLYKFSFQIFIRLKRFRFSEIYKKHTYTFTTNSSRLVIDYALLIRCYVVGTQQSRLLYTNDTFRFGLHWMVCAHVYLDIPSPPYNTYGSIMMGFCGAGEAVLCVILMRRADGYLNCSIAVKLVKYLNRRDATA